MNFIERDNSTSFDNFFGNELTDSVKISRLICSFLVVGYFTSCEVPIAVTVVSEFSCNQVLVFDSSIKARMFISCDIFNGTFRCSRNDGYW